MARERYLVFGFLVGGYLAIDACIPFLMTHIWTAGPAAGLWMSQINLILLWALLRYGSFVVRAMWSLLLSQIAWYALVLGIGWTAARFTMGTSQVFEITAMAGIFSITALVIAFFAHALVIYCLRWRLYSPEETEAGSAARSRQFSLAQLFALVLLICVALGFGRLVLFSLGPQPVQGLSDAGGGFMFSVVAFVTAEVAAILTLVSIVTVLPTVWATFTPFRRWYGLTRGGVFLVGIVSILETIALVLMGSGPNSGGIFLTVMFYNLTQCASVHITFLLLRIAGYRLVCEEPGPRTTSSITSQAGNRAT